LQIPAFLQCSSLDGPHVVPRSAHAPVRWQSSDWLQSASEPASQKPCASLQYPASWHSAVLRQGGPQVFEWPAFAMQFPSFVHVSDFAQSASDAAMHRSSYGAHSP